MLKTQRTALKSKTPPPAPTEKLPINGAAKPHLLSQMSRCFTPLTLRSASAPG